jgi:hypothetical protein
VDFAPRGNCFNVFGSVKVPNSFENSEVRIYKQGESSQYNHGN